MGNRLEVSQNSAYLLSKGWCWQPSDVIQPYKIDECFSTPSLLDKFGLQYPNLETEICTASFIDNKKILIGTSNEVYDEENIENLPINSIIVWDIEKNLFTNTTRLKYPFGNLTAIDERYAWDIFQFPKIIDMINGDLVDKAEEVFSGNQNSSIRGDSPKSHAAFTLDRSRLAIMQDQNLIILTKDW